MPGSSTYEPGGHPLFFRISQIWCEVLFFCVILRPEMTTSHLSGLAHRHVTYQEIHAFLCEVDEAGHRRLLLHLLATCPVCAGTGREILDAYERKDFGLGDPMMVIDTAVLEHRALLALRRWEADKSSTSSPPSYLSENPWGWAVQLARASLRLAPEDPAEAMAYAQAALCAAAQIDAEWPATEAWSSQLEGFAWAAAANAARVRQDYADARTGFDRSLAAFGKAGHDAAELPYRARAYDLMASFYRDQGAPLMALSYLEDAISLAEMVEVRPEPSYAVRLLIKKSLAQVDLGDFNAALLSLDEAERSLAGKEPSPLHARVAGHRLHALVELGAVATARDLLPDARRLMRLHGNGVDVLRIGWTEARLLNKEGEHGAAADQLNGVFNAYLALDLGLDAALVLLDLAETYLRLGEAAKVRELARTVGPLLQAQGLQREQLACLRLFFLGARDGNLEVTLLQELGSALRRLSRQAGPKNRRENPS
jgi:tetratricopeptide (TPR) repeat protein